MILRSLLTDEETTHFASNLYPPLGIEVKNLTLDHLNTIAPYLIFSEHGYIPQGKKIFEVINILEARAWCKGCIYM